MKARLLFTLFFASLALDLALAWPTSDWRILPAALVGWYAADLASGLVHMYADYRPCKPGAGLRELYFWEGARDTPEYEAKQAQVYLRISRLERMVYDFKKHHPYPDLLGRHSFWHLMKAPVFLIVLPVSLALNVLFVALHPPGWAMFGAAVLLAGAGMTQALHGTLHRDDVGPVVTAMRRLRLLMSRRAHKLHHDKLTQDFAFINGWSNPVVNFCASSLLRLGLIREEGLEPN